MFECPFTCSYNLRSKIEEHRGLTITTHRSQQVEFFQSLIFLKGKKIFKRFEDGEPYLASAP